MKRIVKIVICCVLIVVVLASTLIVSSAYSVEQGNYSEIFYTPKYVFDLTAFVGEDANPNLHKLKTYLYSSAFNTGVPTYQTRYPESLDAYYAGAQYGFKTNVYSIPGDGLNDTISTDFVSLSNQYWDSVGTIYDPFYFGNAYKYILQTAPGVLYGFDLQDYNDLFNDCLTFCFLIPQNISAGDEEFDFSSYCDLNLKVTFSDRTIDDRVGLTGYSNIKTITFDNEYNCIDWYGINFTDEAPIYDDTPLSSVYGLAFVEFYPARYLFTQMHDVVYGDDIEKIGLLYMNLDIEVSMTIDSSAIDFSYSDIGESVETSYSHFVDETDSVPIYSVSSSMRGMTSAQQNRFLNSCFAGLGSVDDGDDGDDGDGAFIEDLDFVSWLGNTVFGVLRVEFVPGISIANILYVILGLGVLFLIIKYFAGG